MHSSDVDKSANARSTGRSLRLVYVACGLCGTDHPEPVAVGEDFEYRTSDDTFLMVRCRACGLLYLNPRPDGAEAGLSGIASDPESAALRAPAKGAARMRRRFEARRLLRFCSALPDGSRVLEVGCGDGFRLAAVREFVPRDVRFEAVESDARAVAVARARGLTVHHGTLADAGLPSSSYDLVLALRTLERSGDPSALLEQIRQLLRPGGMLIVETGNAGSPESRFFRNRYWSGYRFPRAWNLFTRATVSRLAASSGLHVRSVETRVSPLGWIFSIRNVLLDARAPNWLVERFSRRAPALLALFTVVDALGCGAGGGSLLDVILQRPVL